MEEDMILRNRVIVAKYETEMKWSVIVPSWGMQERGANMILRNYANKYVEWLNCGVIYRMIRLEDAAKYVDCEIQPYMTLDPYAPEAN